MLTAELLDRTSLRTVPGGGVNELAYRIPFNRPSVEGREMALMLEAVEQGHTSADGPFSAQAAGLIGSAIGAADVVMTTSCTAALEMSALLLDIGPGDVVVVPSFGFVTTALAFARQGATIRFCDIEADTLGLDPAHLEQLMDDTVRAVVPIHYAGVACRIDRIAEIVGAWPRAELVEDNAHGLFGSIDQRPLGGIGRFSTLSFHETKNFICGEGGALVVNRPEDIERTHVLFDKGTNRKAFLEGHVDKYTWIDTGSSFGMSDILAAYLVGQLEQRESILANRKRVFDRYCEQLGDLADEGRLRLPVVPDGVVPAYHMIYVLLEDAPTRAEVMATLNAGGILATFHYVPLHRSPAADRFFGPQPDCPVTDDLSARLLRLPMYTGLADADIDAVTRALREALGASPTRHSV